MAIISAQKFYRLGALSTNSVKALNGTETTDTRWGKITYWPHPFLMLVTKDITLPSYTAQVVNSRTTPSEYDLTARQKNTH